MHIVTAYIAAATNRYTNVASVSPFVNGDETIAFGSAAYIAVWNTVVCRMICICSYGLTYLQNERGVYQTLPGHDGVVTAVCFVARDDAFISVDNRGIMKYWIRSDEQVCLTYLRGKRDDHGHHSLNASSR